LESEGSAGVLQNSGEPSIPKLIARIEKVEQKGVGMPQMQEKLNLIADHFDLFPDITDRICCLEKHVGKAGASQEPGSDRFHMQEDLVKSLRAEFEQLSHEVKGAKEAQKDARDVQRQIESLSLTMGTVHAEWKGAVEDVQKAVDTEKENMQHQVSSFLQEFEGIKSQIGNLKENGTASDDNTSSGIAQSLTAQIEDLAGKLRDMEGTAQKHLQRIEAAEEKLVTCESQTSTGQVVKEPQGCEGENLKSLEARINAIQKQCDSTSEHLQVAEAALEQNLKECEGRQDTKVKDIKETLEKDLERIRSQDFVTRVEFSAKLNADLDFVRKKLVGLEDNMAKTAQDAQNQSDAGHKVSDVEACMKRLEQVETKLRAKDAESVAQKKEAESTAGKLSARSDETNRRLESCEEAVATIKRSIESCNEKADEVGNKALEDFSALKERTETLESKMGTVLFDDGSLDELKASQSLVQDELKALKNGGSSGTPAAGAGDASAKIGQIVHEMKALSSAQETSKTTVKKVSDDLGELQKQCQNAAALREVFDALEQKVELGLGTQVKTVFEQMKDMSARLKELEHEMQDGAARAGGESKLEQTLESKLEKLSEDFVDIDAYKQGLEHTLKSMAVLSERIEAAEEQMQVLKDGTHRGKCRPSPLNAVGISGSKEFSDSFSTLSTTMSKDQGFNASLTTDDDFAGQTRERSNSSSSLGRSSPRSDVGEEPSPKPASTAASETEAPPTAPPESETESNDARSNPPENVSKTPEVESEPAPPMTQVESEPAPPMTQETEDAVEKSTVKRDRSPDSVSSEKGEKKVMMAAAAFFAARCKEPVRSATKENTVKPDASSSSGGADAPQNTAAGSSSSSSVAFGAGDQVAQTKAEEPSSPSSLLKASSPSASPSSYDVLDQSGASVVTAVDVSVADSLELEKCDFVEAIAQPQPVLSKVETAPTTQIGVSEQPAQEASFGTRQDERYDEDAFDDDISEEIEESIECFDDSVSLKNGFESDAEV
jgi:hypothetical protein